VKALGPDASHRIDRFELAVLAAFAVVSMWVLALDLWQVFAHARVWTGTDGVYVVDQLQYLAWIREASRHVLVANLFVLRSTPADYFQPAIVLSGGLSALGVAPWLSLLLWKPVAVGACFYVLREYVHRSLRGRWPRRTALVLALFFGSLTVVYGSVSVIGDLFPGFLSWGYVFGLLALAAMVGALLSYDRAQAQDRIGWAAGLLGALASSLHPWHGEVLIVVVLGAELAMRWGRPPIRGRLARPALTVVMTALPLAYYALLEQTDGSWRLGRVASNHTFPAWSILLEIAPLLLPALLAYHGRPRSFLTAATRIWPIAAFAVFGVSTTALGATPLHAFQGITIPLSILAIQGVRRAGFRRLPHRLLLGSLAIAAFTIPATWYQLDNARGLVAPRPGTANFITPDEHRALDYLANDRTPGGVISRSYLGALVPGETGRHTLVGDCLWSQPHCSARLLAVRRLFEGSLTPSSARRFVLGSGARFLLADCRPNANLDKLLRPIIRSVHRFGCARVYEIEWAPHNPGRPTTHPSTHAATTPRSRLQQASDVHCGHGCIRGEQPRQPGL